MKRLLVLAVGVVAAALGGSIGRDLTRSALHAEPNVRSLGFLLQVASKLNASMPMMVDAETELTNVGAEQGVIVYNYRLVSTDATSLDPLEVSAALRPSVTKASCSNPKTRHEFLDNGIVMRYVYFDRSRRFITSFDVTHSECPT